MPYSLEITDLNRFSGNRLSRFIIGNAKATGHRPETYLLTYLPTYLLMELSPSGGAANSAATQEFSSIL
jgi:hypothetical protein